MPRVYVGNLASSVTSRALHEHFSRTGGVIRALAVSDKASGLCRGFGFVEMERLSDVEVAISLLNNSELNGQRILIEPEPALKMDAHQKKRRRDNHTGGEITIASTTRPARRGKSECKGTKK